MSVPAQYVGYGQRPLSPGYNTVPTPALVASTVGPVLTTSQSYGARPLSPVSTTIVGRPVSPVGGGYTTFGNPMIPTTMAPVLTSASFARPVSPVSYTTTSVAPVAPAVTTTRAVT